jgi:hypothetical protein
MARQFWCSVVPRASVLVSRSRADSRCERDHCLAIFGKWRCGSQAARRDGKGRYASTQRISRRSTAFFAERAPFDHGFCSAARTRVAAVRELPLEDAYASFDSKFWGAYRLARVAKFADGGSLTLTSGFLSVRPRAGAAIQGAINAALEGSTRGLALEFAPVRVNCRFTLASALRSVAITGGGFIATVALPIWIILRVASCLRRGRCDRQAWSLFPGDRMDRGSHSLRVVGS